MNQPKPERVLSGSNPQSGFNLLELMITIVIVGVLAGIAVPMYTKGIQKARQAEGEAALGSIRSQVLMYYGEYGEYPTEALGRIITQDWHSIKPAELDGTNFTRYSYYYQGNATTYLIGLHRGDVLDLHRSLNQNGDYEDWDLKVDE
ncbi:MAG: prepilin-type N-terminal cleavage/methylation domain-containing protein [Candidatus Marinimicrobia bacterium]|nr:prepilin-type N-terminal cleavage/methylation domain-containing protein [Candidatus Neomarinimicrobiota bacterium]